MADEMNNQAGPDQPDTTAPGQDGPAVDLPDVEQANLKEELEQARTQAAEYLDGWQRARAELANYRRRVEKDQAEMTRTANSVLISRLLPVLDDFQRAFQTLPPNLRDLTWIDGVALIERKLAAILEAEGLSPIEALGQQFDPALHEAVTSEVTAESPDGQVIAEYQKGYKLNDRVLRPAMVKVAKRPE